MVTLALRQGDKRATVEMRRTDAASLGALLRAASDPNDEADFEVDLRGTITINGENEP